MAGFHSEPAGKGRLNLTFGAKTSSDARFQEVQLFLEVYKRGSLALEPHCTLCPEHNDYKDHMGGPKRLVREELEIR